jgi:O-antigen ligase
LLQTNCHLPAAECPIDPREDIPPHSAEGKATGRVGDPLFPQLKLDTGVSRGANATMPHEAISMNPRPATLESDDVLDSWAASALVAVGFALSFFFRGHFGNETILFCIALALPLLVAMAVAFARIRRVSEMDFPAATIPVTLFWMWIGMSLLWSRAPGPGLLATFAVSGLPLGFWVYLMAPNRQQMGRLLGGMVLASVVAIDLYAFLQFAIAGVQRPASLFLDPNNLGALNLLAGMPVLAALMAETLFRAKRRSHRIAILSLCLLLMVATVGLSASRSALLAAVPGILIVAGFCWKRAAQEGKRFDRRYVVAVIGATALLAILAATGAGVEAPLVQRFSEFAKDPLGTALPRLTIWEASLRLLPQAPWYGTGIGVYWLLFPRVQNPEDLSRGFNSHNDYLQLLIEGGVPAILFLAAIIALSAMAMVRLWRSRETPASSAVTAAGLFAGLVAFWLQSTIQSNLYLLPLSLIVGLMLGRFHDYVRVVDDQSADRRRFCISGTPLFWAFVATSVTGLASLALTSAAAHYYERGTAAFLQNDLPGTDDAFDAARSIVPVFDTVHIAQADLNVKRLFVTAAANDAQRSALTAKTEKILEESRRFNPLRPDIYLLRGHLYLSNARIDANQQVAAAKAAYEQALALDPKFSEARVALSVILARTGDPVGARQMLEQGMVYNYVDGSELLQYYRLTAQLRMQAGDTEGALQLAERANAVEARIMQRRH